MVQLYSMYAVSTVHSVHCTARVSGGTQYRVSWPASRWCEIMVTVGCSDKSRFSSLVLASLLRSSATATRGKGTIAETYFRVESRLFPYYVLYLDRVFLTYTSLGTCFELQPVFLIRIRIHKIHKFLSLPDSLVRGIDPNPNPDLYIIKKNSKENLDFYSFVTSL
jgi:hypothetical protein